MNDACEAILNRVVCALQARREMVGNTLNVASTRALGQDPAMDHLHDVSRLRWRYYEALLCAVRDAFDLYPLDKVEQALRDAAPYLKGSTERATYDARSSLELGLDIVAEGVREMQLHAPTDRLGAPLDTFTIKQIVAEAWSALGMGEVHEVVLVESFLPMLAVLRALPDVRRIFPYGKAGMLKVIENRCERWAEARAKAIRDTLFIESPVEKPSTFDDYADVP